MRKPSITILLIVLLLTGVGLIRTAALDSLEDILDTGVVTQLERGEKTRHTFTGSEPLTLFPDLPIQERIVPEVKRIDPTIGVEMLLLYSPRTAPAPEASDRAERRYHLRIYNILRSVSTLAGIEYYSASRNRMRTFFYDAYAVESVEDRTRKPDPLVSKIPINDTEFAYLSDSSLGQYVAEVNYHYHYDYFAMKIQNRTVLRWFIFPIMQPEKLNMFVLLVPHRGRILFYGLAYVEASNIFGIAEAKTESFYNRLRALFDWFQNSLDG